MFASLLTRLTDNDLSVSEDDFNYPPLAINELSKELKLLLTSCARIPNLEKEKRINQSVLNYGINNELTNSENEQDYRLILLHTISRFEPRLSELTIDSVRTTDHSFDFLLRGLYHATPVVLAIQWDKYLKQFTFNE